jgi:hypothetical protein
MSLSGRQIAVIQFTAPALMSIRWTDGTNSSASGLIASKMQRVVEALVSYEMNREWEQGADLATILREALQ